MRRNVFKYRLLEDGDYEQVLMPWWNAWHFPPPPLCCLPKNGVLVSDVETSTPLYAAYLYFTDSSIVWMEWIVSNKSAPASIKRGALEYLTKVVNDIAGKNALYVYASTNSKGFQKQLEACGFMTGDRDVCQLIKKIN